MSDNKAEALLKAAALVASELVKAADLVRASTIVKEGEMKLTELEKAFIKHLTESGEIRSDIKNVKDEIKDLRKVVYWMVGGGVFINLISHLWH